MAAILFLFWLEQNDHVTCSWCFQPASEPDERDVQHLAARLHRARRVGDSGHARLLGRDVPPLLPRRQLPVRHVYSPTQEVKMPFNRQKKHQASTQTQTVITLEFSLLNV